MAILPDATRVLVFLLCVAAIILVVILIALALRLLRLVDEVQRKMDQQVMPLLSQVAETVSRVNAVAAKANQTLDWVGAASGLASSALTKLSPASAGQHLAARAGKAAATIILGLAKVAAAARERKRERMKDEG